MVSASAGPDDVRNEIDTNLGDSKLNHYLNAEALELDLENDLSSLSSDLRKRLEVLGAVLRIIDRREKETSREQRESASHTFEKSTIERIESERERLADSAGVTLPDEREQADFEVF